jgi:hypothetical protein
MSEMRLRTTPHRAGLIPAIIFVAVPLLGIVGIFAALGLLIWSMSQLTPRKGNSERGSVSDRRHLSHHAPARLSFFDGPLPAP